MPGRQLSAVDRRAERYAPRTRLPDLGRAALPQKLPRWPPVLATRGPGGATSMHAHHAMHLMIAVSSTLRVKAADDAIAGTIGGSFRLVTAAERDALARDAEPAAIMREGGEAWTRRAVDIPTPPGLPMPPT